MSDHRSGPTEPDDAPRGEGPTRGARRIRWESTDADPAVDVPSPSSTSASASAPVDRYDAETAAAYDEVHADEDPTEAVALLASLARDRPAADRARALEFAIGTGRVALPLAAVGVDVAGIEYSPAMIARLRAKDGGTAIPVVEGDMVVSRAEGVFDLVYLVFNTVMNLTSQDAQVACVANAARHLAPGGRFVVEVIVPDPPPLGATERNRVFALDDDHVGVDEYVDPVEQVLISHHWFGGRGGGGTGGAAHDAASYRYVWPSELDLMARLAGMSLEDRWGDWDRSPFTAASPFHVSVYRRAT